MKRDPQRCRIIEDRLRGAGRHSPTPTPSMNLSLRPGLESRILTLRAQRVMLDTDLAELYGVTTKRLNEQVKRNADRFPGDFMFKLTPGEKAEVVANCDHLTKLKFSKVPPFAFTEHGAIQAANVLATPQAVEMGIFVVRAFVRMRELADVHADLPTDWPSWKRRPKPCPSTMKPSAATHATNSNRFSMRCANSCRRPIRRGGRSDSFDPRTRAPRSQWEPGGRRDRAREASGSVNYSRFANPSRSTARFSASNAARIARP